MSGTGFKAAKMLREQQLQATESAGGGSPGVSVRMAGAGVAGDTSFSGAHLAVSPVASPVAPLVAIAQAQSRRPQTRPRSAGVSRTPFAVSFCEQSCLPDANVVSSAPLDDDSKFGPPGSK